MEAAEVVSKGQFAQLANVSPGRVSQWIAERKIYGDALIGEGRSARIHVARARAQLRLKLDVGQRFGNGLGTRLADEDPAEPDAAPAPAATLPKADPYEDQIKREKYERLARLNRREAEEEAARAGRFVEAAAAQRQMGVLAEHLMRIVEGALVELATAVAGRFQLQQRDVLHLMRQEFRTARARAGETLRRQAEAVPALVEAELETRAIDPRAADDDEDD